jgi:fructose-bisphosphate aldolase class II
MPVVDYKSYQAMLKRAKDGGYAYPAINVTSSSTANAAIQGFVEANCDGIVQVSTGGGQFNAGQNVKDMVLGAIDLAEHIRRIAERVKVNIAIHTDHCPPDKVDSFLIPLIEETEKRRAEGKPNLFNSHMFDGSSIPLEENIKTAVMLQERCVKNEILLEVEAGVVGGEEDGVDNENVDKAKLFSTPEDMWGMEQALAKIGPYMFAATFGNVHGVYKPGNVKLKPSILGDGQKFVAEKLGGKDKLPLNFVFHGGSGSLLSEIHEALNHGVVKMNVDTDTQYAYARGVADHMFKNYDGMLRIDGDVGNKKMYDPRVWMKAAENSMAARVVQACEDLKSKGTHS